MSATSMTPLTPSPRLSATGAETHPPHRPPLDPASSSTGSMSGSLAGIKRHPEFWFDDGNLILVANNDTAFRIYAGLLASQSDVFAGLFDVASSSDDEVYDGCPVVPVHDTPGQFAHFLRVLLPEDSRNFYRTSRDTPLTFDHAAAAVHLANKYCLPAVRKQAFNIIREHAFPSDDPHPLRTYPNPTLIVEDIHAIGAVNIARLLGKPKLLLPALYRCAVLGSAVLDGWTRDDGVVEHLTPADLKLCMDARAALARENVRIFSATFQDKPHKQCANPDECLTGLRKLEDTMLRCELGKHHDVVDRSDTDLAERATAAGVCERCGGMLKRREDTLRKNVWKRLPTILGIEVEGWR